MRLDINDIYHQYIIRIVIFSLFLYKKEIRNPVIYKFSVTSFINKRLPWKINIKIDTGIKLDKEEERDIFLNSILNDIDSDYLSIVTATFTTPLKQTTLRVDLNDENGNYEKFIYS